MQPGSHESSFSSGGSLWTNAGQIMRRSWKSRQDSMGIAKECLGAHNRRHSRTLPMALQFGDFTLDESRRQVMRGDQPLHLSPKAFQLLSILIERSPQAIAKTDLQERLWPETFVTEGNLAGLVAELRQALGDDAKEPRFIRTLYGFGYSFAEIGRAHV